MKGLAANRSCGLLLCVAAAFSVGCWPRAQKETLDPGFHPTTLLEGYDYAANKAHEWSPASFLEGASAGYRWKQQLWEPYGLTYIFVDTQRHEYTMIVLRLETHVAELNPPVPIERSAVTTLPFLLVENPVDEQEALEIADAALGNDVVLNCSNPELALHGVGFGEDQFWGVTYTAYEPMWMVVGELSVDAVTGAVVYQRDFTDACQGQPDRWWRRWIG
jgi:hypothetical protein